LIKCRKVVLQVGTEACKEIGGNQATEEHQLSLSNAGPWCMADTQEDGLRRVSMMLNLDEAG
jgi:hypothetical protein